MFMLGDMLGLLECCMGDNMFQGIWLLYCFDEVAFFRMNYLANSVHRGHCLVYLLFYISVTVMLKL